MIRLLLLLTSLQIALVVATADAAAPRLVDERRAARVGLRKIVGKHLRLYTDLPSSDAVDGLPLVFDAAVPLWADYFRIDATKLRTWRMQGYLMQDRAKFAALGLLPKEKSDFDNGYSSGRELWLMEQPSDYFRRHLLLHEGTHGFMYTILGGVGPGWYMEGMAELLGTHRWGEGQLQLRVIPNRRQDVPMWGRMKLVRDAYRDGKSLDLPAVMALDKRRTLSTDQYAWCWALCEFLDSHPRLQQRFRRLPRQLDETGFNQRVRKQFRSEWPDLQSEWQAFVATLDYGYDTRRMMMEHRPYQAVGDGASVSIAADRGWQSSGWLLQAGQAYRVTAEGRYQIATEAVVHESGGSGPNTTAGGVPWPCEPGGVTLEYHAGRPLGMLLGAWRATASNQFSAPIAVGLEAVLTPSEESVLYLRVNDSPARLSDNRGVLKASVRPAAD